MSICPECKTSLIPFKILEKKYREYRKTTDRPLSLNEWFKKEYQVKK